MSAKRKKLQLKESANFYFSVRATSQKSTTRRIKTLMPSTLKKCLPSSENSLPVRKLGSAKKTLWLKLKKVV